MPRQATDEVIETVERWGHLGLAAHALGVQRTSLENRLKKAGVWDADRHGFTPREDATIRLEYEPGSVMSLADQLDRSWLSVVRRAFRIGAIDTSGAEELLDGDGIEVQGTAQPVGVIAPGDPVAWQRAGRVSDRTFTPKIVEKAEQRLACRFATILTMRLNVSLHCVFYRATMRSADVDNLVKLVLDAGNDGALWEDDSQVTTLVTRVTIDREHPRTEIHASEYRDEAMPRGSGYLPKCESCGEPFKAPERKTMQVTWCSPECKAERTLSLL